MRSVAIQSTGQIFMVFYSTISQNTHKMGKISNIHTFEILGHPRYLKHISDISGVSRDYFCQILILYQPHLMQVSVSTNLRLNISISQAHIRHISVLSQSYLRHNTGIPQTYIRHISNIYQTKLRYLR